VIPTGTPVGLITYVIEDTACEIVTLDSLYEGVSIGSGLVMAVRQAGEAAGCARLWLVTTNDNTHAMRFYQRRGFRMTGLFPDAIEDSRRIKPTIPLRGNDGIPIRDEVLFELVLR
jgi:ribosomal protein S18 acetylase RimI-like enzyme